MGLPGVTAEGQTKEEAGSFAVPKGNAKAKVMLQEKLAVGEFVTIEVESLQSPVKGSSWAKHRGIFADDPTFDDFLAEVEAYRRSVDAQDLEDIKE
ncbi:MAG: hypothetical protein KME18_00015 [Phormidium tanganyikae FI6-MK23]|nr:hypothetical protein [Phormidium tanganyikae FI6-MK23]